MKSKMLYAKNYFVVVVVVVLVVVVIFFLSFFRNDLGFSITCIT